jgi:hypothetical protein
MVSFCKSFELQVFNSASVNSAVFALAVSGPSIGSERLGIMVDPHPANKAAVAVIIKAFFVIFIMD